MFNEEAVETDQDLLEEAGKIIWFLCVGEATIQLTQVVRDQRCGRKRRINGVYVLQVKKAAHVENGWAALWLLSNHDGYGEI